MADGVNRDPGPVAASDEHAAEAPLSPAVGLTRRRAARRSGSPHSHKFLAATALLIGVAVGAVAVAVAVLASSSGSYQGGAWSSWKPPDGGIAGEREIANQVAPFYRATPADQLVVVTVQDVTSSSSDQTTGSGSGPSTELAVRDPDSGALSAIGGTSAVYNLCGLGPNCAIAAGAPSSARLLLLRREALELALYTFKYIGNVQNVVAVLPPGRTETTTALTAKPPAPGKTATPSTLNLAVFFARASLSPWLDRPLQATLPETLPPTVSDMPSAPEAELVSLITGQALFEQQLVQAQDGSNVMVLNQLPAQ